MQVNTTALNEDFFAECRSRDGNISITDAIAKFLGLDISKKSTPRQMWLRVRKRAGIQPTFIHFSRGVPSACAKLPGLLKVLALLPGRYPQVKQLRSERARAAQATIYQYMVRAAVDAAATISGENPMLMTLNEKDFAGCRVQDGYICITDAIAKFLGKTRKQAIQQFADIRRTCDSMFYESIQFQKANGRLGQPVACAKFSELLKVLAKLPAKYEQVQQLRGEMARLSTRAAAGDELLEQALPERRAQLAPEVQAGLLSGLPSVTGVKRTLTGVSKARAVHKTIKLYAQSVQMMEEVVTLEAQDKVNIKDVMVKEIVGGADYDFSKLGEILAKYSEKLVHTPPSGMHI